MHVLCLYNGSWACVSGNTKHSFVSLTTTWRVDAVSALLMGALTFSPAVRRRAAAPHPLLGSRVTRRAALGPRRPLQPLALHWTRGERGRQTKRDGKDEVRLRTILRDTGGNRNRLSQFCVERERGSGCRGKKRDTAEKVRRLRGNKMS